MQTAASSTDKARASLRTRRRKQDSPTARFSPEQHAKRLLLLKGSVVDVIDSITQGFNYKSLEKLGADTGLSVEAISSVIGISPRTLLRRKNEKRLSADESDRLYSFSRIFSLALGLFEGDGEQAREWLFEDNPGLGGASPLEMMRTAIGAREVEHLIRRLEYGIFT